MPKCYKFGKLSGTSQGTVRRFFDRRMRMKPTKELLNQKSLIDRQLDYGAISHMTGNQSLFENLKLNNTGQSVLIASNHRIIVEGVREEASC